ncbi:UrcA family protein [Henriciella sp. AS95]|uniref:UrcA family protein n=1 Tax=Henriciella sp. AS95 TaxID=3135782 RepID=UPI00317674C3
MFSKKLAIASLATATLFAAGPALADDAPETNSVDVSISGFDLTTEEGSAVVLRKIENAAEKVCGARSGPQSITERNLTQKCVADAMSDALDSLSVARQRQADLKNSGAG